MMNKQTLSAMWDFQRQKHGITLRLIDALPEDKLHSRPIPNMRTPAELVTHLYGVVVRDIATGILNGNIPNNEAAEKGTAAGLRTRQDLVRFVEGCWKESDGALQAITDKHLAAMVPTGWGTPMPGWMLVGVMNDEYLHHRGQLYAFARALGVEPPMLWDFANNAAAYRPKEAAKA